ncbi:MAG TPA: PIN domain-containing protein [Solirubrobacteraceae bacterium]|nr:PIN domain-containing protein [Solirubrobacteraceae bacterium]
MRARPSGRLASYPTTSRCPSSRSANFNSDSQRFRSRQSRAPRRADTLARTADPIPISESVMVSWARLVADCRSAGIHRMVKITDALIAATAIEYGLAVLTQDHEYDQIPAAHPPLRVIKV